MIGVNVDITEREEAQAQRELLLAELNHRVKNTLAVVQALAQQSFKGSQDSSEGLLRSTGCSRDRSYDVDANQLDVCIAGQDRRGYACGRSTEWRPAIACWADHPPRA